MILRGKRIGRWSGRTPPRTSSHERVVEPLMLPLRLPVHVVPRASSVLRKGSGGLLRTAGCGWCGRSQEIALGIRPRGARFYGDSAGEGDRFAAAAGRYARCEVSPLFSGDVACVFPLGAPGATSSDGTRGFPEVAEAAFSNLHRGKDR